MVLPTPSAPQWLYPVQSLFNLISINIQKDINDLSIGKNLYTTGDYYKSLEFESSKKIVLSFILPSGVYATTFLENFFEF